MGVNVDGFVVPRPKGCNDVSEGFVVNSVSVGENHYKHFEREKVLYPLLINIAAGEARKKK